MPVIPPPTTQTSTSRSSVSGGAPTPGASCSQRERGAPGSADGVGTPPALPRAPAGNAQGGAHAACLVVGHRADELVAAGAAQRQPQRGGGARLDGRGQAAHASSGAPDDEVVDVLAEVPDVELQRAAPHPRAIHGNGELAL